MSSSNPAIVSVEEKIAASTDVTKLPSEISPVPPTDPSIEKALLRKLDLHVVAPLSILFLLAFLDRVNIGNSKIQGMTKDLDMKGHDYNVALLVFFPPYIFFEVPSNIILRRISPSLWISTIMTLWGITTICEGLIHNNSSLIALRFLLGTFEAGFSPGSVYLISMYYKRYELQWRLSLFFAASILAGAFGGLFAYALVHMDGVGGYAGWRWIFIIEGLITVVVAVGFKIMGFIADWPETATFLNTDEKTMVMKRLQDDIGGKIGRMDRLDKKAVKRILGDWKVWCGCVMYFGVVNTGYSTSFFIPTILNEMGYMAVESQVKSIPIYCVAAVLSLIIAYMTDKLQHRYGFTMAGVLVGSIGYIILLCQEHVATGVKYMACFFIVAGGYMTQPVVWAWFSNNISGHYKRSLATGLQIGLGNIGGIVASNIFITNQAPRYPVGYGVSFALLGLCGVACTIFWLGLRWENLRRERVAKRGGEGTGSGMGKEGGNEMGKGREDRGEEEDEWSNAGDDHPAWRFVL